MSREHAVASVALLAAWAAAGCFGPHQTYRVRQASLVPAATLPPPPAYRGLADLYVGDSTVTFLLPPELAPDEDAGLWIPRTQLEAALSVHVGRRLSLRLLWLDAFPEGAMAAAPTTLARPDRHVSGAGIGVAFGGRSASHPVAVDVALEIMGVAVPSRVSVTCLDCTDDRPSTEEIRHQTVGQVSFSMSGSWFVEPGKRLFLTLAGRNHPTNVESFTSDASATKVYGGPFNLLVGLGAEFDLGSCLAIIPQIQLPVMARPVRYGPIFGLGLRGSFDGR